MGLSLLPKRNQKRQKTLLNIYIQESLSISEARKRKRATLFFYNTEILFSVILTQLILMHEEISSKIYHFIIYFGPLSRSCQRFIALPPSFIDLSALCFSQLLISSHWNSQQQEFEGHRHKGKEKQQFSHQFEHFFSQQEVQASG